MRKYNLIYEPWILVRDLLGNLKEFSILDIFFKAKEIAFIEDQSPLVTVSIYRFLLAILYRAFKGPCDIDEAKKMFKEGLSKEKIQNYLKENENKFFLFDEDCPFSQISEKSFEESKLWTELATEHNDANSKVLFDHIDMNSFKRISPQQAIKWILAIQTFALGGGHSGQPGLPHRSDAPFARLVMAIPLGKSLEDTFLFCLVPQNKDVLENDLPVWERKIDTIEQLKNKSNRVANGYSDLYTWRSRSIRLPINDNCSIHKIAFTSGLKFDKGSINDPMVCYYDKKERKMHKLKDRGFWRDFDSLLPDKSKLAPAVIEHAHLLTKNILNRRPQSVIIFGQSANKAKISFWRMEHFKLPPMEYLKSMPFVTQEEKEKEEGCLRTDIHKILKEAEDVSGTLEEACEIYVKLNLNLDDLKKSKEKAKAFVKQMGVNRYYWSILEEKFHEILSDFKINCDPEDIYCRWLYFVYNALEDTWNFHKKSILNSTRAIKAFIKASKLINEKKYNLREKIKKLEEA